MTDRSTAWSLTINNPTPSDEEGIALARQRGWKVEGQLEKGQEGTLHYQLLVKTPQVRFSAVKKAFPRAHIEVARNVQALQRYVTKQDTRQSQLSTTQEKYPSLSKLWDLIFHLINDDQLEYPCSRKMLLDWDNLSINCVYARTPPLTLFDNCINILIKRGYHVESIAVNPATRAMWKSYYQSIYHRSWDAYVKQAAETDRQTDTRSESEQSIVMETHNSDEDERSEARLSGTSGSETSQSQDYEDGEGQANEGYSEGTDSCFGEEDD